MIDSNTMMKPIGWSIASIAVIGFFCVYAISTIVSSLFAPNGDVSTNTQTSMLVEQHNEYALVDIARFNGRSAFFKPIPKPRPTTAYIPPPEEAQKPPEAPKESAPPRPPENYTGPPLIAIIGDEAWFRGSGSGFDAIIQLRSGQERDGLTLISTQKPTKVMVQHQGGDYTIDLFTVDESFFLDEPPPASRDDFFEEVN